MGSPTSKDLPWPGTAGVKLALLPWKVRPVSLAGGILYAMLAVHAVILPSLYWGIDRIVVRTHSELFLSVAHAYMQARVREFASRQASMTPQEMAQFVDDIQSSGLVVYSELDWNGQTIRRMSDTNRTLNEPADRDEFGKGDDQTYHLVEKIRTDDKTGSLRLGFDEAPITSHIVEARVLVVIALTVYLGLIIGAAAIFARRLAAPLERLRNAATHIAAGDRQQTLGVESRIIELHELAKSLERMRSELVDADTRLHMKQRLETVGTLAGGVAHEFNNILVPLTLFTESALTSLPVEHIARPWLTRAIEAAKRAREVVSKLLLFGGRGVPSALTPMSIAPPTEEALRLFARLRPTTIELNVKIDPEVDSVLANSGHIVQIVMNLCTNASYAIPQSGGIIAVTLRNVRDADRKSVELIVEDNGIGMDDKTMQRIFEPFFTTREIGKGSGLGLSVVHGLVAGMNASISVRSAPGAGATFQILFPSVGT
jgi:signal transduction histidine kinase